MGLKDFDSTKCDMCGRVSETKEAKEICLARQFRKINGGLRHGQTMGFSGTERAEIVECPDFRKRGS